MKIKITALSNNVYQFADKTLSDNYTGTWRGRIVNAPDISRSFSDLGSVASTLYIQLINHDLQIPLTEDLWNASIDVETDNGYKWSGKVSAYETNADGKMYITATETTAPEYSRYIPDEFARLVSIDEDVHMSALNVTIPTVIGGNTNNPIPVKGILKSKSDAIYYLCIGEIHDIVNVRVGDTTMTKAQAEAKGYMCYTGSASQTNEPGIAYIQITDTTKRLNDDGSYVDIGAEVIGLKLGTHTVEECRNGARFLYWLLKTSASGACGWGLGISTNDIDTASFETAITYVDLIGLKLDGIMYDNRSAQNWIDEICRAIRGTYEIGTDGKRRLTIDVASTSSYTYTKDNIELVRFGAGAFTGRVYNKGTLDYCYNPITGMFMQTSQYQNAESIERIDEQLFEGESYLIRDAETAQKIVEYTCKKSLVEANKILFNTRFLPENCRIGTVITINYPEKGMNNSLFKITSLQIGDHINRIEAVKYDISIYESGSATATVAWQNEEPILSSVSVVSASGLTLNSGFDILPDGTGIASITGSFTMPNGSYITAIVEYGETASPSTWLALGLLKTGSFKISPVKVNTVYSVRIRLVTSTGHSDYVTGTINTVGDNTPPGAPTIAVSTYLKTTRIKVALNNPPPDLAGFEIWRSTMEGDEGTKIGYIAATNGSGTFVDIDVSDYLTNVYYSAVSVDLWGNRSDFSAQIIANCAKISVQDVIADWIMANTFETARGVGELVDGVKFNADGIQGWKNHLNVFNLNANGDSIIGGWTIGSNKLYSPDIEIGPAGVKGSSALMGTVFDLNMNGTAKIGGWHIDSEKLYCEKIQINSNGTIQTSDYVSDLKGWCVNQDGDAEFNNAKIRGTIKTAVFEKDNISVVGGYQLIRPATVVSLKNETSGSYDVYVEDNSEFAVNDIVRMKLVTDNGSSDVWAKVTAKATDNENGDYITLSVQNGTWFVPEAGQTIVNYGPSGSGGILMDGNAPKMDLYTHNGSPWNDLTCHVRIGNLNGINGITTNKYGFFAGNSDSSAANRHYIQWDGTNLNIQGQVVITSGSTYNAINTAQSTADTAVSNAATAQSTANTANNRVVYQFGTCDTAADTAAKVVTLSNYPGYFTGSRISVKFTNPNTVANPTLNVNSKGAKTIRAKGANLAASSSYNWVAGDIVDFVYDGTYWNITSISGIDVASADATAKVKVVTDNIYTANTTTIDGGKITTNTVEAKSLTVSTTGVPRNPLVVLKAHSNSFASGKFTISMGNPPRTFVATAAFSSNQQNAFGYVWRRTSANAASIALKSGSSAITLPESFSFSLIYRISDWSKQPVFFDARVSDSSNANRVCIYCTTARVIKVDVYNSEGTATTITLGTCVNNTFRRLTIVCDAGTWTSYDSLYNSTASVVKSTSSTTAAHASLSAALMSFMNLAVGRTADRGFIGYFGHIYVYPYALSESQHYQLVIGGCEQGLGLITADMIIVDELWTNILDGNYSIDDSHISDVAASKITGAVPIAHGGTGATTRLAALKALTNESVGTSATYFLTITDSWGKGGYSSVANVKSILGNATQSVNGLMSSTDKTKLDGVAENANNYVHPTTAGNKHIPSGGSSGQVLAYSSAGTAAWTNVSSLAAFVKSGSSAAKGLVPSPGTTAGTTKFLCEDATWKNVTGAGTVTSTKTTDTTNYRCYEMKFNSGFQLKYIIPKSTTSKAPTSDETITFSTGYTLTTTASVIEYASNATRFSISGGSLSTNMPGGYITMDGQGGYSTPMAGYLSTTSFKMIANHNIYLVIIAGY